MLVTRNLKGIIRYIVRLNSNACTWTIKIMWEGQFALDLCHPVFSVEGRC